MHVSETHMSYTALIGTKKNQPWVLPSPVKSYAQHYFVKMSNERQRRPANPSNLNVYPVNKPNRQMRVTLRNYT